MNENQKADAAPAQAGATPGPWKVYGATKQDCKVMDSCGREMAIVRRSNEAPDEADTNARLIAAAPELLSALQSVEAILCSDFPDDLPTCQDMIRRALSELRNPAIARAGGDK